MHHEHCHHPHPENESNAAGCGPDHHHKSLEQKEKEMEEELYYLGKKAWEKLMIKKIKKNLDEICGSHLDDLAKVIAETKMKKWQAKMGKQKVREEFRTKVHELAINS